MTDAADAPDLPNSDATRGGSGLVTLLLVAGAFLLAYGLLRGGSRVRAVERLRPFAEPAAQRAGIDTNLLLAVVAKESGGDPRARSSADALGLTQLKLSAAKDAARFLGAAPPTAEDLYDPQTSLRLGAAYLRILLDRFKDRDVALAAYLKGPEWVQRQGGVDEARRKLQTPSEIASYVHGVADLAERFAVREGK